MVLQKRFMKNTHLYQFAGFFKYKISHPITQTHWITNIISKFRFCHKLPQHFLETTTAKKKKKKKKKKEEEEEEEQQQQTLWKMQHGG